MSPNTVYFYKMSISLLFVVTVIYLLSLIFKKVNGISLYNKDIHLDSSMYIGNKERLMIVNTMGKKILIGVTQNGIQTLYVDATNDAKTE